MNWPDDYDAETVAMSGGTGTPAMEWAARQETPMPTDPTTQPKCPECGKTMLKARNGAAGELPPVMLRCLNKACRTTRPLGWTGDEPPPAPRRDGDALLPAGGGEVEVEVDVEYAPVPLKTVGTLKCIPADEYDRLIAERDALAKRVGQAEEVIRAAHAAMLPYIAQIRDGTGGPPVPEIKCDDEHNLVNAAYEAANWVTYPRRCDLYSQPLPQPPAATVSEVQP